MTEPLPLTDITEQLEDSAERELPKIAECEECSGLDVEELIVHGDAAAEIVRVAKERNVDLILSHRMEGQVWAGSFSAQLQKPWCVTLLVRFWW